MIAGRGKALAFFPNPIGPDRGPGIAGGYLCDDRMGAALGVGKAELRHGL